MTTRAKIQALIDELATLRPGDADPKTRDLIEGLVIVRGLGFDPISLLMPETDADADYLVDALISLLLQVRGDDLPPFDFERHVREATASDEAA
jgi:hypothetical protein